MKGTQDWLSNLKVRLNYGTAGNKPYQFWLNGLLLIQWLVIQVKLLSLMKLVELCWNMVLTCIIKLEMGNNYYS